MRTWPLYFSISNGAIQQPQFSTYLNRLLAYTKKYGKGEYQLTIKRREKKGTTQQNRYYWGVVNKMIHQAFIDKGNDCTTDDVHYYLVDRYPVYEKVIGEIIRLSYSGFSVEQKAKYIDNCIAFASEVFSVIIPDPDEAKQKLMY